MKKFQDLYNISQAEMERQGFVHTVREIRQQPGSLDRLCRELLSDWSRIERLYRKRLVFLGAGSSAFVGDALLPTARQRGIDAFSIPTTDLVTHPAVWTFREPALYVSFARSGNSPESMAAVDLIRHYHPEGEHLAVTCNARGRLAEETGKSPGSEVLLMPEETNDESLVMTSSVSVMYTAGLALILGDFPSVFETAAPVMISLLEDTISRFGERMFDIVDRGFKRVHYLGSGSFYGISRETRLKIQEMTEGRIVTQSESFLGLRHGPQVFINNECLTVAYLSSDPRARTYEEELLLELKSKKQGKYILAVCARDPQGRLARLADEVFEVDPEGRLTDAADRTGISPSEADAFMTLSCLAVGQLLGVAGCLSFGLKPDAPSETGIINRVVSGITILPVG